MNKICVCGAGTMGIGIAQVAALSGFTTTVYDVNETVIEKARRRLDGDLQRLVDKQRISRERKEDLLQCLNFTYRLTDCVADVVIEAVVERPEVKTGLFQQLSALNSDDTVFASNTSSLSVSALAKDIPLPHRMAGMHFFNPAPLMKLVEIVRTDQTADHVIEQLIVLAHRLGKVPVVCKDAPGFIVNRVARPYYIESLRILEEGHADVATIDKLLENQGFKMGPFKLMDLIGNDVNYAVSCSVYEQLGHPDRLKPSFIQKEKVDRNELGKKTGKGYYEY